MLRRRLLYLCVMLSAGGRAAGKTEDWKLPLEFEANRGQFAADVLFLARTPSHFVYLTRRGLTLGLNSSDQRGGVLQMQMVHADPGAPAAVAEGRAPGISNYFIGSDRSGWRRQVPHYERVRYRAVWAGIDLVFHGNGQTLEYDFSVAPGADPSRIRLTYANARKLSLDAEGGLVIETGAGRVVQRLPEIYQERDGVRTAVRGAFRIAANGEVRFEVGSYDRRRALVIDPTITYSTYIAGTGTMAIHKSVVDSAGNLYLTGQISSPDFPVVNPVQQFSTNVGLFRSANQGAAWGAASGSLGTAKVTSLGTDPSAAAIAYAGTSQGIFKTSNAGATWTSSSSGLPKDTVTSLTVDPLAPSTLYACTPRGLLQIPRWGRDVETVGECRRTGGGGGGQPDQEYDLAGLHIWNSAGEPGRGRYAAPTEPPAVVGDLGCDRPDQFQERLCGNREWRVVRIGQQRDFVYPDHDRAGCE